jgi:N-acetylglucosaminyl-diphospho-decaprenol L-rhamnosyltransferase
MPNVSVIVANWNTSNLLADCLNSVLQTTGRLDVEIIVVDNASTDGSVAIVRRQFPFVTVIANSKNVGFARANNQGAAASHGRYLLLLNSDARLLPDSLQSLVDTLKARPSVGLIGAQLRNPDGSFQASYSQFPGLWQEFLILSSLGRHLYGRWYPSFGPQEGQGPQIVDYVEGACMLLRREAYQAVGGLDEAYFMYAEDVELCYALKEKGWQVCYQPAALVVHLGGGSSQNRQPERESDLYCSRVRFFRRHYGFLAAELLLVQIVAFTSLKLVTHGLLRRLSHGRYGRSVVPLRRLAMCLRQS